MYKNNWNIDDTIPSAKTEFQQTIIKHLECIIKFSFNKHKEYIDVLPSKLASECMSYFLGVDIRNNFILLDPTINVVIGKEDNDNDLVFIRGDEKYVLEIKVSKSVATRKVCWRGGELSVRECDHLLVNWTYDENRNINVYACIIYLTK